MKLGQRYGHTQLTNGGNDVTYLGIELEYEACGSRWDLWPNFVATKNREAYVRWEKFWMTCQEYSLRGREGVEFKYHNPVPIQNVAESIDVLQNAFGVLKVIPRINVRTGLHVHLNVRDMTIKELQNLMVLYALFEPVWYTWTKAARSGNVFCQPWWRDFGYLMMFPAATNPNTFLWSNVFGKYSGLNLCNVDTLGTVEFRHMPSTFNKDTIMSWCWMIDTLRRVAFDNELTQSILAKAITSPKEALRTLMPSQWGLFYYPDMEQEVWALSLDVAMMLNRLEYTKDWYEDRKSVKKVRPAPTLRVEEVMEQIEMTAAQFDRVQTVIREANR